MMIRKAWIFDVSWHCIMKSCVWISRISVVVVFWKWLIKQKAFNLISFSHNNWFRVCQSKLISHCIEHEFPPGSHGLPISRQCEGSWMYLCLCVCVCVCVCRPDESNIDMFTAKSEQWEGFNEEGELKATDVCVCVRVWVCVCKCVPCLDASDP